MCKEQYPKDDLSRCLVCLAQRELVGEALVTRPLLAAGRHCLSHTVVARFGNCADSADSKPVRDG